MMTQIALPAPAVLPASNAAANSVQLDLWRDVAMRSQMWELIVESANDPVIVTTADPFVARPLYRLRQRGFHNSDRDTAPKK